MTYILVFVFMIDWITGFNSQMMTKKSKIRFFLIIIENNIHCLSFSLVHDSMYERTFTSEDISYFKSKYSNYMLSDVVPNFSDKYMSFVNIMHDTLKQQNDE
jgi:uncharacterized membrane protein required for colicin V production